MEGEEGREKSVFLQFKILFEIESFPSGQQVAAGSSKMSRGQLMKLCCGIVHKGIQDALHNAGLCLWSL